MFLKLVDVIQNQFGNYNMCCCKNRTRRLPRPI